MAIRTGRGRAFQDREREAVAGRLFEGVLRSARSHLMYAVTPLAAEVWASGLFSVWQNDAGEGDDTFCEALVRHAQADGTPEAAAALCALAGVVPAKLATRARTAAAALEKDGVSAPAWATVVGQALPTEAWVGRDVYGDQEIVIVGFRYPGAPEGGGVPDEHTVCVLIDHNLSGMAKDAYLAAALPETLERWREAEANGISLTTITLAEAAARLEDALLAAELGSEGDAATRLLELRALLAARLEAMPAAVRSGPGEVDLGARERLVAEFLSAREAESLLSEPAVVAIAHHLVDYRADRGDGDPLRWSPTLASSCLLHHFPGSAFDEADLALVPDVLAAWVRFAGQRRGLPPEAVERVASTVDDCRQEFSAVITASVGISTGRFRAG